METSTLFADVILPLPIPGTFTYRIPRDKAEEIMAGKRVVVQFGKRKIYSAVVLDVHDRIPQSYAVKYILDILDDLPVVNEVQLRFWRWMSEYYLSTLGEVMHAALPSGFKLAGETRVLLNPGMTADPITLNEKETRILEALGYQHSLTIHEISKLLDQKKVMNVVKTLLDKSLIITEEEIHDRYRPRQETFVYLNPEYEAEDKLHQLFDELNRRAFKQLQMLVSFLNLAHDAATREQGIRKTDLIKSVDATYAQFNALEKKGVFLTREQVVYRMASFNASLNPKEIIFTGSQEQALSEIREVFAHKDTVLLHGVTSSGKTEIYIRLIQETIEKGEQVLYLLPEIALTTQIIQRLRKYFGNKVGVYHSRFNEHERVEIWKRLLEPNNDLPIILGARSSLFLPFSNLGLIIVDEEYDTSFKQFDPGPRYHARDSAIYLAHLHKAKTILGSATPSYESYFNALSGKYGLVSLNERYGNIQLPETKFVDLRRDHITGKKKAHFTSTLLHHIRDALDNHHQVILFQNRRGFSTRLECHHCGYTPSCTRCDITLTYHKSHDQLRCHYCGYSTPVPARCPSCGSNEIFMKGFGTEKVEEELQIFFPQARIRRMDLDTTRGKFSHQEIINEFEAGRIDVLVGTQMVTKGLDFDNVSLVGIMNADNLLNFPDFRSFERGFQLITQVSGRAGRKNKVGTVIIQTYNAAHPILQYIAQNAYHPMFLEQMKDRQKFRYPPYYRLIRIRVKHRDPDLLNEASGLYARILKKTLGNRILGPEYPLVARIKNQYIKDILVKSEKDASISWVKSKILEGTQELQSEHKFKGIMIQMDIDPV
ncbi:MAG: primosomal protein N' [Bacteroidetes bacterium]|nr:primosomal protein N' [Bacteroidota bacterium]